MLQSSLGGGINASNSVSGSMMMMETPDGGMREKGATGYENYITKLVSEVGGKTRDDVREKSVNSLVEVIIQQYNRQQAGNGSSEVTFNQIITFLNRELKGLVQSPNPSERIHGIYLLNRLLAVDYEYENKKIPHFWSLLDEVLFPQQDYSFAGSLSASASGASSGNSSTSSSVSTTASAAAAAATASTGGGYGGVPLRISRTGPMGALALAPAEQTVQLIRRLRLEGADHTTQAIANAASTIGQLAKCGGAQCRDFVEKDIKTGVEKLRATASAEEKLAAVYTLHELALNSSTIFYMHMGEVMDNIWLGLSDKSPAVRLESKNLLDTCLRICTQREKLNMEAANRSGGSTKNGETPPPSPHDPRKQSPDDAGSGNINSDKIRWCKALYDKAEDEVKNINKPDGVHGALLVCDSLVSNCVDFLYENNNYANICANVLMSRHHAGQEINLRESKDTLIRNAVIALIPKLALCNSNGFNMSYLFDAMSYLFTLTKNLTYRSQAFAAIGNMILVLGTETRPYLENIGSLISANLSPKAKGGICLEAIACAACLAVSFSDGVELFKSLMETIFGTGLNAQLVASLEDMSARGVLSRTALMKLWDLTVSILTKPYTGVAQQQSLTSSTSGGDGTGSNTGNESTSYPIRLRSKKASNNSNSTNDLLSLMAATGETEEIRMKTLALETLSRFDFSEAEELMDFVNETLVRYLDFDNTEVRRQAAIACGALVEKRCKGLAPTQGHAARVVLNVIQQLVVLGITDRSAEIRQTVFSVLGNRSGCFDNFLAKPEILRSLFMALGDESFDVRRLCIQLLGRLTQKNPAFVIPALRKTLMQLMNELEYGDERVNEESALLLGQLIQSAERLVKPYVDPLLRVLLHKLKASPRVASAVLSALGELSTIGSDALIGYTKDILPAIIGTLHDQSSQRSAKREIALRTLGKFVRSIGHRVSPLTDYPQLLDILISDFSTERQPAVRTELLRVVGILGAIDPYRHKQNHAIARINSEKKKAANIAGVSGTGNNNGYQQTMVTASSAIAPSVVPSAAGGNGVGREHERGPITAAVVEAAADAMQEMMGASELPMVSSSSEEYIPTVVISALLRILKDTNLSNCHKVAVKDLIKSIKSLNGRFIAFLPYIFPVLIKVTRQSEQSLRDFMFQQFRELVRTIGSHIRDYLQDTVNLMLDFWDTPSLGSILLLAEAISCAVNDEFRVYLPIIVPQMLRELSRERMDLRVKAHKVIQTFEAFGTSMDDYLYLVVPAILSMIEQEDTPLQTSMTALSQLHKMTLRLNFTDMGSRIIHPLLRILENISHPGLREEVMIMLCSLANSLGQDYVLFIPAVSKVLSRCGIQNSNYDQIVNKLLRNGPISYSDMGYGVTASGNSGNLDLAINEAARVKPSFSTPSKDGVRGLAAREEAGKMTPAARVESLSKVWESFATQNTNEEWLEWMRQFSIAFINGSPSEAMRSCKSLAQDYPPLMRELFNAAFLSCWDEFDDSTQSRLGEALKGALSSKGIPPECLQTLLNLAEYMEHEEKPLPISDLGALAKSCRAYAKALHYTEKALDGAQDTSAVIEELISINNKLQLPEAAQGVLLFAQRRQNVVLQESWYEKLGRWEDAKAVYEEKQRREPTNKTLVLGRMRCMHALSEWEDLSNLCRDAWPTFKAPQVAVFGASAAWHFGDWEKLGEYVSAMSDSSYSSSGIGNSTGNDDNDSGSGGGWNGSTSRGSSFYRAIIYLHNGNTEDAVKRIEEVRAGLDNEFSALLGESYDRAYALSVQLQQLAELEEVIEYRSATPERRDAIRMLWEERLRACKRNIDTWQSLIQVHSLVLTPQEDMRILIKFSNICRRSERYRLAFSTLQTIAGARLDSDTIVPIYTESMPAVVFSYIQTLWDANKDNLPERIKAFDMLRDFGRILSDGIMSGSIRYIYPRPLTSVAKSNALQSPFFSSLSVSEEDDEVLDECFKLKATASLKLGEWELYLAQTQEMFNAETIPGILASFHDATEYQSGWYKAWHSWALVNLEVVNYYERKASKRSSTSTFWGSSPPLTQIPIPSGLTQSSGNNKEETEIITNCLIVAIHAFFKSIALGKDQTIQDTLRLLTILFKYGRQKEVESALLEGFGTVSVDAWLQVIPQIIARITSPVKAIRYLTNELLGSIGKDHPQALVYPLIVASKSTNVTRLTQARNLMDKMKKLFPVLIEQALLVCQELIRVAILWDEQWVEGLDAASRAYDHGRNFQGMLDVLEPLYKRLKDGPSTERESAFVSKYGRDLSNAYECCQRYKQTRNSADVQQAWRIYSSVYNAINKQLSQQTTLDLKFVSPNLEKAKNMDLAVPGTYKSGAPIVKIAHIRPLLSMIPSKQKPRKLSIVGSNGVDYQFLLKGHEDLRQDERVMQFFRLVNNLLQSNSETSKSHLSIGCYDVVPLSPYSGLIGWVPHSDTLHVLIKEYRDAKDIVLNIEHRLMLQMAPQYDKLTLPQKVEVFQYALSMTEGNDLERILWLKSANSEGWLERRTTYTRSVAVMSMVGYILGLGDRHPSNLMLDRYTGRVVHIDFGDCFEVAMQRDKYPEKIPFRLTRMLINAMEISGIEGNFRYTCENVMAVLRENKDSLMAVLEAFVYDPLLNWRLFTNDSPVPPNNGGNNSTSTAKEPAMPAKEPKEDGSPGAAPAIVASGSMTSIPPGTENAEDVAEKSDPTNEKALSVIKRVSTKLTGKDFGDETLDVSQQVDKLIQDATSQENLCQCYIGWCPFW